MILQPGDVICTRGNSWVSKSIRFFSRGIGESRTEVNHAGVIVWGDRITRAIVVEALAKVMSHGLWAKYGKSRDEVAVFRNTKITNLDRMKVAQKARTYVGRKYGYFKIVTHVLDYALFGLNVFRRLNQVEKYPICSWLVAKAYAEIGLDFGVPYAEAAPDHLFDYCLESPDWELVRPLGRLS